MLIYVLLLLMAFGFFLYNLFYLSRLDSITKYKKENHCLVFFALIFICVCAFRADSVGIDTKNYYNWFNSFENANFSYLSSYSLLEEPGFPFLNILFHKLNLNWLCFKVFAASIYIIPFLLIIRRYCYDVSLCVLIFVMSGPYIAIFSMMRQGIAIGLVLIAILLWKKKTHIFSFLAYLCAITIHSSSIIFIIFYFLEFIKIRKIKHLYILMFICLIVAVLGSVLLRNDILFLASKLNKSYSVDENTGGILTILFYLGMLVVFLFFVDEKNTFIINNSLMIKLFLVSITLMPIFAISPAAFRIVEYFSFSTSIFFVNSVYSINKKIEKGISFSVFIAVYLYLFFGTLMIASKGVTPYEFFWSVL